MDQAECRFDLAMLCIMSNILEGVHKQSLFTNYWTCCLFFAAANATVLTLCVALAGLLANSGYELLKVQTHQEISGIRESRCAHIS